MSKQAAGVVETVVEVEGLARKFGELTAVAGLSLGIERGEVFGLLGPNGAGKTTTIKMLAGLLRPTAGKVFIDGEQVGAASRATRRKIGLCPQEIVVWHCLTCLENLVLMGDMYEVPRAASLARANELLAALNLSDRKNVLARDLSGGMKRRLNLAMALIHDPPVLFLDEPTAGLDPQSRLAVFEFVEALGKGGEKTVVLTTHDMEEADRLSRRVAVIDHGKLLVLDTPANLKKTIGRGDVVEITLYDRTGNERAMRIMRQMPGVEELNEIRGAIVLRALDAVNMLPAVFHSLKGEGLEVLNVSLRSNSLENVFITLTGRGLRE